MQPAGAIDAEAGRGIALRIEIDDQDFLADGGERGAEIDRGRGFADAAFLVGDGEHARGFAAGPGAAVGRRERDHAGFALREVRLSWPALPIRFACVTTTASVWLSRL